jgi:uncharacterized membrane protein YfcA
MTILLGIIFFITAVLYAAVGLGGGSGYLAMMGLLGVSPEIMRPTALALNILVAGMGTWRHVRAGNFSPRLFWPIAFFSLPFAFIGGRLSLTVEIYRPVVGVLLLYAAAQLWLRATKTELTAQGGVKLPLWAVSLTGAAIGLVSGLIGLGGGVFLGPILLLTGWSKTRQTMGVTAAFVFVNSVAGLLGNLSVVRALPAQIPFWLLAAGLGGWLGTTLNVEWLDPAKLRRLLAAVLLISALRLIFI